MSYVSIYSVTETTAGYDKETDGVLGHVQELAIKGHNLFDH